MDTPQHPARYAQALNWFLGLTQEEIAQETGTSFTSVNAWCVGRRQPRADSAARLCTFFERVIRFYPETDATVIAARLHASFGSPTLGNYSDPLDELFFILLSLKTSHATYEETFVRFKEKFHPWNRLLESTAEEVEAYIRRGGLGSVKAKAFVDIAQRLQSDFGVVSLDRLRALDDEEAEEYLTSLPGVGIKTARCVLMYSLDREVLPVDTHTYRVGARLGLVGTSKSSSQVHRQFAEVIPPHLRYAIHTNFVALGRTLCRDAVPYCSECPINQGCPTHSLSIKSSGQISTPRNVTGGSDNTWTAVDLYCGTGGLSAGLRDSGFDVAYALDWDPDACNTHAANFPDATVDCADVRTITGERIREVAGGEIDLLAGGPNCQGVSQRGIRSPDDPRNFMIPEFIRLVSELQPEAFLMENVPGFTHRHNFNQLRRAFEWLEDELGYECSADVLLATDHGVPQLRYRFFMIGTKVGCRLTFPAPTHRPPEEMGNFDRPYVTVSEAINDLPAIDVLGESDRPKGYKSQEPSSDFQVYARKGSTEVRNHVCSATDEINLRRAAYVPEGGNWKDIPEGLLPDRFFGCRMTDHSTTYARLRRDQPAFTITSLFGNITAGAFTHPVENRALSVREGARLQGFRDNFVFCGARSSQYRQVGNAIPPLLAAVVAGHLKALLAGENPNGRPGRITRGVLEDRRSWDALPVLTPRFRSLFGTGTRWPAGWGAEPHDLTEKLDGKYRLRPEYWPDSVQQRFKLVS